MLENFQSTSPFWIHDFLSHELCGIIYLPHIHQVQPRLPVLWYNVFTFPHIHHCEQVEPRLSILTKRMILLSEHYQDIKRFGPFGHSPPAHSMTTCDDIALIESAGTLHAIFAQFSPVNHSLVAIQFVHKLSRIPLKSDEPKSREGLKFGDAGTRSRNNTSCSPLSSSMHQGYSDKHRKGEDPDKIGLSRGDLFPCKIHKTMAPHAGEFDTLTEHSFVERLVLSDNEFIVTAQLAMTEVCLEQTHINSTYTRTILFQYMVW